VDYNPNAAAGPYQDQMSQMKAKTTTHEANPIAAMVMKIQNIAFSRVDSRLACFDLLLRNRAAHNESSGNTTKTIRNGMIPKWSWSC
jgi:hypothetical protein